MSLRARHTAPLPLSSSVLLRANILHIDNRWRSTAPVSRAGKPPSRALELDIQAGDRRGRQETAKRPCRKNCGGRDGAIQQYTTWRIFLVALTPTPSAGRRSAPRHGRRTFQSLAADARPADRRDTWHRACGEGYRAAARKWAVAVDAANDRNAAAC